MKLLIGVLILSCLLAVNCDAQFVQQGNKLFGSGSVGAGSQGGAVAISADGKTALVGSSMDSPSGATWVFVRVGGLWSQEGQKLVGTGAKGAPHQGTGVALSADGNTALVGGNSDSSGTGAAWVFTRTNGTWVQQGTKLVGTGGTGPAHQGVSVALAGDGNTAIIGGNNDNTGVGAVWIFTRSNGVWSQDGEKLIGSTSVGSASQGSSVALSGDGTTAIEGGPGDDRSTGGAWVFTRTNGTWAQQGSKLVGSDSLLSPRRGASVSISADGNTAAVGGPIANAADGGVCIFVRTNGAWTQEGQKLVGSGASTSAQQGYSVSLSANGNTLLEGGYRNASGEGAAWVFERADGEWVQTGTKLVGTGAAGLAGQGISSAISSDANTVVLGGYADDGFAGAAWVFSRGSTAAAGQENFLPDVSTLEQNYPNPFNPSTMIHYRLSTESFVSMRVFDLLGREVAVLVHERISPGSHEVKFDGAKLGGGVYFCRMQAGDMNKVIRLVLLR